MEKKRVLLFLLVLVLAISIVTFSETSTYAGTDREEILYITGQAWGAPSGFNHLAGWATFPVDLGSNPLVYEPLFLYNYETEGYEPLIGQELKWLNDYTIEVKLQDFVYFSDGEQLTAEDVAYSYGLGKDYYTPWAHIWTYLDSVEATDEYTVVINLKQGENYNRLVALDSLTTVSILPEHIWSPKEEENGYDPNKLAQIFNEDPIGSGAYKIKQYNESSIVLERNDNYWGKKLFGSLPKPRYIVHRLFEGNEAASMALKENALDYSENFHADVAGLMKVAPIKTYKPGPPYYTNDAMPFLYINHHKAGLDNVVVRRALAYAINYQAISEKAMNGYSSEMDPSLMTKNENELELINAGELEDLKWEYNIDKANEILDSIGAQKGDDGVRVLPDGTRLGPWKLVCPNGWTDWNATLEIVAQSARDAGFDLVTEFPEYGVYDENLAIGEFDFMMYTPAELISPTNPWKRAQELMYSEGIKEIGERAQFNFTRYKNDRADQIIEKIPTITDKEKLKELYTELNIIYLTDIPAIPLLYRPTCFYTVNETYWQGFPTETDPTPAYLFRGAGYKGLYTIESTN